MTTTLIASPIHHTVQIGAKADHGCIWPMHSVVTPIVALTAVLTSAPATSRLAMCGIRSSEGRKLDRWRRYAPATASSVFPVAIPTATGSEATVAFANSAPIQTPGQARSPNRTSAANAMPVGGHTAVAWGATNASASPSFAAPK